MGDVDDKDITTRDAGLSNRHNLQGGSSPRWHGGGLGHSQINDDDGHSGWISGIAQYGLTSESEVTMSFDDTPNQIGLQWSVNTGARANAETQPSLLARPLPLMSTCLSLACYVIVIAIINHQSVDKVLI